MAVTGDETESGRVSLTHTFTCVTLQCLNLLPFSEICMYCIMLSVLFFNKDWVFFIMKMFCIGVHRLYTYSGTQKSEITYLYKHKNRQKNHFNTVKLY